MAQVHHHHWYIHHHHWHLYHRDCEQGALGKLGSPGNVLGVDISEEMIRHCSDHYNGQQNLSFQVVFGKAFLTKLTNFFSPKTLDVSNGADFCIAKESSFDMASTPNQPVSHELQVTSFSCLHWVPNQPDAVSLFNKVLKPGGKFLFVVSRIYICHLLLNSKFYTQK